MKHSTLTRRNWRSLSLCAAAALAGSAGLVWAAAPAAKSAAATPGAAAPSVAPTASLPVAAASGSAVGDVRPPLTLDDKPFERPSAGISVRSPKGWTGMVEADREEIVRFVDDLKKQDWSLVVSRRTFTEPQRLMAGKDAAGEVLPGVVESTLAQFKAQYPGAKVLRAGDPTTVGGHDVGVIILRYTKNGERRLAQHAIIEGNDQLFYLVALNSPARKDVAEDANEEEKTVDPTERQAIDTFRQVIDSVKLLDLRNVRDDQTQRLFRTRGLLANLVSTLTNQVKLAQLLVPERYLRIVKNGQDVGYSYIVELPGRVRFVREPGTDGRPGATKSVSDGSPDGITVGIRSRVMTGKPAEVAGAAGLHVAPFPREDSESWMYFASDLKRAGEDWSKITVWDDGKPKTPANPWRKVSEVGSSLKQVRRRASVPAVDAEHPERAIQRGENGDLNQPWVETRESYTLNVQFKATRGDLPPVTNPLPPFYLPQGLEVLLPRLVARGDPKTYMFASYVSELRQVMARYVDVKPEAALPPELLRARGEQAAAAAAVAAVAGGVQSAGGVAVPRGVPVEDRLGYEGTVTTHWVSAKGEYLGSVTKQVQSEAGVAKPLVTVVVPSDAATLKRIWRVADIDNLNDLPPDAVKGDENLRTGPPGGAGTGTPTGGLINPTGPGGGGSALPGKLEPGR